MLLVAEHAISCWLILATVVSAVWDKFRRPRRVLVDFPESEKNQQQTFISQD